MKAMDVPLEDHFVPTSLLITAGLLLSALAVFGMFGLVPHNIVDVTIPFTPVLWQGHAVAVLFWGVLIGAVGLVWSKALLQRTDVVSVFLHGLVFGVAGYPLIAAAGAYVLSAYSVELAGPSMAYLLGSFIASLLVGLIVLLLREVVSAVQSNTTLNA